METGIVQFESVPITGQISPGGGKQMARDFGGIWKQFAYHAKVRKEATSEQGLKLTSWDTIAATKQSVDRARVNWKGLIAYQQSNGIFDPRPRVARRAK